MICLTLSWNINLSVLMSNKVQSKHDDYFHRDFNWWCQYIDYHPSYEHSFWLYFRHWLHRKVSNWQLPIQPIVTSTFPFQWSTWTSFSTGTGNLLNCISLFFSGVRQLWRTAVVFIKRDKLCPRGIVSLFCFLSVSVYHITLVLVTLLMSVTNNIYKIVWVISWVAVAFQSHLEPNNMVHQLTCNNIKFQP